MAIIAKDFTGMRFGKLLVVDRTGEKKHGHYLWNCICDCGNTYVAPSGSLNGGHTRSCGCLQKLARSRRLTDLTGRKFGKWAVLERVPPPSHVKDKKKPYWKCICDCGKTGIVASNNLKSSQSASCGCLNKEANIRKRKPIIAASTAHTRVRKKFGSACLHECVDCGKKAEDWAYDHLDPDELIEERYVSGVLIHTIRFSAKEEHYNPKCKKCNAKDKHTKGAYFRRKQGTT